MIYYELKSIFPVTNQIVKHFKKRYFLYVIPAVTYGENFLYNLYVEISSKSK